VVRGFAVVHCIGILTSMFSAVFFSRGLVNLWYGGARSSRAPSVRSGSLRVRVTVPWPAAAATTKEEDHGVLPHQKDIPFMKYALVFNAISFITFALAVFFLFSRGLHLSVEFTGGTVMEVAYTQPADIGKVRETVSKLGYADVIVQNFGTSKDVMIRLPVQKGVTTAQQSEQVITALKAEDAEVTLRRTEFVGPQVGDELMHNGLMALGMVVLGIIIYLAFRFEWKFGVAAIIANLHDVIIILGFFAFFQWEFSLSVLAGVLAVLGYSVNESVVIFDRIREAFRKFRKLSTHEVIDHAITSTMSRTIITHASTEAMVLSMFFFGGPSLHYFALALTIGILFGIYSSVFVAAAIAMWLGVKREDLVKAPAKPGSQDPNDPNAGAVV
jgi:preprotein translocase subunit SecF